MGPVWQNFNPENCKNCSSKCAYDCAELQYTIQHRTVLIPSYLQTDIIAQMLSIGGGEWLINRLISKSTNQSISQTNKQDTIIKQNSLSLESRSPANRIHKRAFFVSVTLTLTRWPWYTKSSTYYDKLQAYKNEFSSQGFQKVAIFWLPACVIKFLL